LIKVSTHKYLILMLLGWSINHTNNCRET